MFRHKVLMIWLGIYSFKWYLFHDRTLLIPRNDAAMSYHLSIVKLFCSYSGHICASFLKDIFLAAEIEIWTGVNIDKGVGNLHNCIYPIHHWYYEFYKIFLNCCRWPSTMWWPSLNLQNTSSWSSKFHLLDVKHLSLRTAWLNIRWSFLLSLFVWLSLEK